MSLPSWGWFQFCICTFVMERCFTLFCRFFFRYVIRRRTRIYTLANIRSTYKHFSFSVLSSSFALSSALSDQKKKVWWTIVASRYGFSFFTFRYAKRPIVRTPQRGSRKVSFEDLFPNLSRTTSLVPLYMNHTMDNPFELRTLILFYFLANQTRNETLGEKKEE